MINQFWSIWMLQHLSSSYNNETVLHTLVSLNKPQQTDLQQRRRHHIIASMAPHQRTIWYRSPVVHISFIEDLIHMLIFHSIKGSEENLFQLIPGNKLITITIKRLTEDK